MTPQGAVGSNPTLSAKFFITWRSTQEAEEDGLLNRWGSIRAAWVRIPSSPPYYRGIAQLVEQRSPKPRAEGSRPSAPAIFRGVAQLGSATGLGPEGHRFESCHPDHI